MRGTRTEHVAALVLVASACSSTQGSEGVVMESSPTQPVTASAATTPADGADETLPPPSTESELVDWAETTIGVVAMLQADLERATADFQAGNVRSGPRPLHEVVALYEADRTAFDEALAALPAPPPGSSVALPAAELEEAMEGYVVTTDAALTALDAFDGDGDRDPTRADEWDSLVHELADEQATALDRWRSACFTVQATIAAMTDAPLDCVGTPERPQPPAPDAGFDPDAVSVSIECVRGDSLDETPFDIAPHGVLVDADPDQGWILSTVTIENRAERRIQVDPAFRLNWLADDGSVLATTDTPDRLMPAFSAAAGQTVVRRLFVPESAIRGRRAETLPADLLDRVFHRSHGCEFLEPPQVTPIDDDAFVDAELSDAVDLVDCEPDEPAGRWYATVSVTNPTERSLPVVVLVELVDADGERLGLAGTEPEQIAPAETVELDAWTATYTVADPDRVAGCDVLAITAD